MLSVAEALVMVSVWHVVRLRGKGDGGGLPFKGTVDGEWIILGVGALHKQPSRTKCGEGFEQHGGWVWER